MRPARLGQTVSTSPYGDTVTTWETAATSPTAPPGQAGRPGPGGAFPGPPGGRPRHSGWRPRHPGWRPWPSGWRPWPFRGRGGPFDGIDFAIVDVETTGWSPDEAGITEIGAVRVSRGRVCAEFSALVNPGRPIPAEIVALTGISDAMVALAPPVAAVLPGFLDFTRGCVLTAHNAPFDIGFLAAACGGCGLPWPASPVLDTVELARLVLGEDEVPNCKLGTLAEFFGARTVPCHRALADARATADVLAGLLRRLAANGVRTLAGISA